MLRVKTGKEGEGRGQKDQVRNEEEGDNDPGAYQGKPQCLRLVYC